MNSEIIVINPQEFGLEKSEAQKIEEVFTPMLEKMVELEKEYNAIVALPLETETLKKARELRLKYVKVRTGTAEIHKTAKAYYLAGGRFVDAWKNAQNFSALGKEEVLEKIEKHFELIEQEKKEKLNEERQKQLVQYVSDVTLYNLKDMSEAGFTELLASSKVAYEARLEAERKAEEDRLRIEEENRKEQERIRLENEELKKQAEAREKELAIEREKARVEAEAREKLEAEKKQKELEAKAQAEAELKEKKEAEKAPDREKLIAFAVELGCIEIPKLQTEDGKKTLAVAVQKLQEIVTLLKTNL